MADTVGGLLPQGELITIGVTPDPLPISPVQLITPGLSIVGHPSGTAKDVEETMHFAVLSGVRAWIEELPLSQAADGYAAMEQGRSHLPHRLDHVTDDRYGPSTHPTVNC